MLRASFLGLVALALLVACGGGPEGQLDAARLEIPLPPGIYEVRFGPNAWKGIEVRPGQTTTISPAALEVSKNVSAKLVAYRGGGFGFWRDMLDRRFGRFPQRVLVPMNLTLGALLGIKEGR